MLKIRFNKIITWLLSLAVLAGAVMPMTAEAGGGEPALRVGGINVLADDYDVIHYWKASESGGYVETDTPEDYLFSVMKTDNGITLTMNTMSVAAGESGIDALYTDLNIVLNGRVTIGTARYGINCEVGDLKISAAEGGRLDITASEYGIFVNNGDIEISSGIIKINVEGDGYCTGIDSENGHGVEITGGDITVDVVSLDHNCIGLYAYCPDMSSGGFSISGGRLTIEAESKTQYSYGIYSDWGDISISGGNLSATAIAGTEWESRGIYEYEGLISISGGSVTATAETATGQSWGIDADNAIFTMTGGTVRAEGIYGIHTTLSGSIEGGYLTAVGTNTAILSDAVSLGVPASRYFYYKSNTEPNAPDLDEFTLGPVEGLTLGSDNKYVEVAYAYALTYELNGGTNNNDNADHYLYGAGATLAAPTKENNIFGGWYEQPDFAGSPVTAIGPEETVSKTLYAKWTPAYTVTAAAGSGGAISPSGAVNIPENGSRTFTITPDSGYEITSVLIDCVDQGAISVYTFSSVTASHAIDAQFTPVTYTLTYDLAGGTVSSDNPSSFTVGSADITLVNPTKPGYSFTGWSGTGISDNTMSVTVPAGSTGSRSYTANWTATSIPSAPSRPTPPTYSADVSTGSGGKTTVPVAISNGSKNATIDTGSQKMTPGDTLITVPSIPGVNTYSVGIPVPELSMSDGGNTLTLSTDTGNITVPSDMLTGVGETAGNKAYITIGTGDKSLLPDDVRANVGDRPLIRLTLSIDGRQINWSNPDAPVTVSVPYTPSGAEVLNPESIVIWYIDGGGNVVTIPNGRYDAASDTVVFTTTHFSGYAVAYNNAYFSDLAADDWYCRAVSFIAARDITTGMGNGNFNPESKLTRGEFIVLLMRAYSIAPDENPADNFADAGSTFYTGYLAAAKRLGISAGTGYNIYAPGNEITRQEMFTLLYNALKVIGQLPEGHSGKTLPDFTDYGRIAPWASKAMTLLVKTGAVSGSGGALTPTGTVTRAEMAQMLYNLLYR